MHSVSTAMPPGSAPAWMLVRAGNGAVKNVRYTSFIAAKSLMSRRYTLHFITSSSDEPAAWRIARRFSNVRFVSDRTSPSSRCPVCGLVGPWPATKIKSPSTTACEYGPIGFGACSVTTACLMDSSAIVSKGDEREILPPQCPGTPQAPPGRLRDRRDRVGARPHDRRGTDDQELPGDALTRYRVRRLTRRDDGRRSPPQRVCRRDAHPGVPHAAVGAPGADPRCRRGRRRVVPSDGGHGDHGQLFGGGPDALAARVLGRQADGEPGLLPCARDPHPRGA